MPRGDGQGTMFRAFEPCKVQQIEYHISDDGRGFTLAQVHLSLLEPLQTYLAGRVFTVDLPPPVAGHAEFVVLRSRFQESCLLKPALCVGSECDSASLSLTPAGLVHLT